MELTQLRYFQKVARTQSINKAARELYISQPTLSQSLRRLEASLGSPLFIHQQGKRMQLNEAGKLFLEKVDRALAELDEGVQLVQEHTLAAASQIALASSIHDLCSELVLDYFKHRPNAKISHRLIEINSLTELLLNDEIDFALSPCPLSEADPRIESRPLYVEEQFAIAGPTHHLYGRTEIDREELRGEHFICNYSESDRNYLDMLFEQEDVDVDIILESNEPDVIRQVIAQGAGVAFIPARIVMRRMETGDSSVQKPIRVTGYHHTTPTCISKKKSRTLSAAANSFYEYVIDYCERENELVQHFIRYMFPNSKSLKRDL